MSLLGLGLAKDADVMRRGRRHARSACGDLLEVFTRLSAALTLRGMDHCM